VLNVACERCATPLSAPSVSCHVCAVEGRRVFDPWLGRVVGDRFRVVRRIARTTNSAVHEVVSTVDGTRAALKSHRIGPDSEPSIVERFLREARAILRVRHPSIVEVYDVGQVDELGAYFVLEFVPGETVRSLLKTDALGVRKSLAIATQMADALEAVHGRGVVHRDLKPENVVVVHDAADAPRSKLIDFGIASIADAVAITSSSQVLGTPGYMAPEYVRDAVATPFSDQYSLGVLVYEMLSSRLPYDSTSAGQLLVRQATTAPIRLRDRIGSIDDELEAAVMRAIDPTPEARHPSIAAFRSDLASASARLQGAR